MPKKMMKKQKKHREFCRQQAKSGLMNRPDGGWEKASGTMGRSMLAGYHVR